MSYSMTVALAAPPDPAKLLALDGVSSREELDGGWPDGAVHLYRAGRSTRGIEVAHAEATLSVRMVACANQDDWDLAFAVLGAIGSSPVSGEDGTEAALADVRTGFQEVMLRELALPAVTLAAMIEQGHEISLPGIVRDVHFGRRMLADVGKDALALLERIRRIQYIEDEGFDFVEYSDLAAAMGISSVELGFSIWDPAKAQAFGPTTQLSLKGSPGGLTVPVANLAEVAGARFAWLDEKQFTIEATPEAELAALFESARAFDVDPHAAIRGSAKKWWQFWKR